MEGRIVIRNAVVAGPGPGTTVVLEGPRIAAVLPAGRSTEPRPSDWDVDADGRLVVPGVVDGHTRLALGALVRAAGFRVSGVRGDSHAVVGRRLVLQAGPAELEPLARAGALASLKAGVTTVFDLSRGTGDAGEAMEAVARGVAPVGVRARLSWAARGPRATAEVLEAAAFVEGRAGHPTVRGGIGTASLSECSEEALEAMAPLARAHGLQASVGDDEADLGSVFARFMRRPVDILASRRLLGPRAVVARAGTMVHGEAELCAALGAYVAATPRSAMIWGAPMLPMLPFAALGVKILLGTDGLFPNLACEAIAAAMSQRQVDRGVGQAAAFVGRVAWPAASELASSTFGEPIGGIAEGAAADLVILDWRPIAPLPDGPDGDVVLVWAGAPAAWTIVRGEVRLREGRLLGGDEAEIAAKAREAAVRVLA